MSWTPKMTKEAFTNSRKMKLFRLGTKRWFSAVLEPNEPMQIVCRLELGIGELLKDKEGTVVVVTDYDGFSHNWTYKPIGIEIVEASTCIDPVPQC